MSRLTAAHRAAERLRAHGLPQYRAELDAITLALGRMAQLEKVAELAKVVACLDEPLPHDVLLLRLALTELDNHPDTREPQVIAELVTPIQDPVDQALADGIARMNQARNPSAEAAARRAWDSWRDQRGPGVTEAP